MNGRSWAVKGEVLHPSAQGRQILIRTEAGSLNVMLSVKFLESARENLRE